MNPFASETTMLRTWKSQRKVDFDVRERSVQSGVTEHPRLPVSAETRDPFGSVERLRRSRLEPRAIDRALADLTEEDVPHDELF